MAARRRLVDLLVLLLLVGAVLVWWYRPRVEPVLVRGADSSRPIGALPADWGTPAAGEDGPVASGEDLEILTNEILEDVRGWARAWTRRDTETYLAHYAPEFETPYSMSRQEWESWRRDRLTAPDHIRVALAGFELETLEGDRATVVFFQSYRSDLMSDTIRKRLDLVREGRNWRIVSERVIG